MEFTDGAVAGGVVAVALGAFQAIKAYAPKLRNGHGTRSSNELRDAVGIITEKDGDGVPLVYTPRGDIRRMTESLESTEETGKQTVVLLEAIHEDLKK